MMVALSELVQRFCAEDSGLAGEQYVSHFALDHREVRSGSLFIAIKGANVDGHQFCQQAMNQGAVACLVTEPVPVPHLLVSDTIEALANLARSYRNEYSGRVIGITGSVGKTSAKEFVVAALSAGGTVSSTQGNRNSEYSGPLLWPEVQRTDIAVVAEMGMRGFGQIAHLASFHQPQIGIITNIGHSHLELVGSREGIMQAKTELFEALPEDGISIFWHEDDFASSLRSKARGKILTFGYHDGADSRVKSFDISAANRMSCHIDLLGEELQFDLPVVGKQMALNACIGLLVAKELGINMSDACSKLTEITLPQGRMQFIQESGNQYIFDAYNAAPESFEAAIDSFVRLSRGSKQVMVIGEMKELGDVAVEKHRKLAERISELSPDQVYLFQSANTLAMAERFKELGFENFEVCDQHAVIARRLSSLSGATILLKGSRGVELEKVLHALEIQLS